MKALTTTFAKCHDAGACAKSYRKMAKAMGGIKNHGRNTKTTLVQVLDILGLDDALWVLDNATDDADFIRSCFSRGCGGCCGDCAVCCGFLAREKAARLSRRKSQQICYDGVIDYAII